MHPLLAEGLTDAVGFLIGVFIAYWGGMLLGFDPLAQGFENNTIGGIVLAGIGGGAGLQIARRLRANRKKKD